MTTAALSPAPHLVVFGRDAAGKAHASWFDQPSAELATKAAGLMGMHAVAVESDALRELAATLPKGRVFSSGRAFTPFVAAKLYTQLVELTRGVLGLAEGAQATAEPPSQPTTPQPEAVTASSATDQRSCTDPGTRAEIRAAVQDRLSALGMPRYVEALGLLSRLGDAHSPQPRNVAAVFQRKSGLPTSAFKLCKVSDPSFDDPMFVTVLFVNPETGQPGGLVMNFGFPGAMAAFGDRMQSAQP